jgi:hypothetical protein
MEQPELRGTLATAGSAKSSAEGRATVELDRKWGGSGRRGPWGRREDGIRGGSSCRARERDEGAMGARRNEGAMAAAAVVEWDKGAMGPRERRGGGGRSNSARERVGPPRKRGWRVRLARHRFRARAEGAMVCGIVSEAIWRGRWMVTFSKFIYFYKSNLIYIVH